jgi:hypothetical protein
VKWKRAKTQPQAIPVLSFCERGTATVYSVVHIREVDGGGLKPGGGIQNRPLCGSDLRGGWDLQSPVTVDYIDRTRDIEIGRTCPDCADKATALLAAVSTPGEGGPA